MPPVGRSEGAEGELPALEPVGAGREVLKDDLYRRLSKSSRSRLPLRAEVATDPAPRLAPAGAVMADDPSPPLRRGICDEGSGAPSPSGLAWAVAFQSCPDRRPAPRSPTVRAHPVERSRPKPEPRSEERFETAPGHQAQVDWSHEEPIRAPDGTRLPLYGFHMMRDLVPVITAWGYSGLG